MRSRRFLPLSALLLALVVLPATGAGAATPTGKASCRAGTKAFEPARGKVRHVCLPKLTAGMAGLEQVAARALALARPLPPGGRRLRGAQRIAERLARGSTDGALLRRAGWAGAGAALDPGPPSRTSRDASGDLRREWDAGPELEGASATSVEHREAAGPGEIGQLERETVTLTRKDGARGVAGHATDDREARCPTAAGVAPGKVLWEFVKEDSAVHDGKRAWRGVLTRVEGRYVGQVGAEGKVVTYGLVLRGTAEVRGGVQRVRDGKVLRSEPTRTFRVAVDRAGIPAGTVPADLLREMRFFGPRGRNLSESRAAEALGAIAKLMVAAAAITTSRLADGDERWFDRRECAKLDYDPAPETVRRGGTATWKARAVAADGAGVADGRWTATSSCGALGEGSPRGPEATFTLTDGAGAWSDSPYAPACIVFEATTPAGRTEVVSHTIEPEPSPKRYRYAIKLTYTEDMGDVAVGTRAEGTATVEDEADGTATRGTGSYKGTEWAGSVANPCGADMGRTREFGGNLITSAKVRSDGTVQIALTGEQDLLRMSWILDMPVAGATRTIESAQPFCGTPGLAKRRSVIEVVGTPVP